jgi:hypothetical protein
MGLVILGLLAHVHLLGHTCSTGKAVAAACSRTTAVASLAEQHLGSYMSIIVGGNLLHM